MTDIHTRHATPDDLPSILQMGAGMHGTSNFSHLRFDPQLFGEFASGLINLDGHAILLAVSDDDEIQGAILCSAVRSFIGPDLVACEHAFYVRPDRRGREAGQKLLQAYRSWAEEKGCRRISAGNSAGMPDEAYKTVMSRAGFSRAGSIMFMNVGG